MKTEVQFYDHRTGELLKSQREKVLKFIEHDCIQQIDEFTYECRPIPGYNTRTYTIRVDRTLTYRCNCQHYVMHETPCSHIGAVWEFRERSYRNVIEAAHQQEKIQAEEQLFFKPILEGGGPHERE